MSAFTLGGGFFAAGPQQPGSPIFAMNNGLSIDIAGVGVLGQDVGDVLNPAILLNDREIPTNAFSIYVSGAGDFKVGDGNLSVGVIPPAVPAHDLEVRRDGAAVSALIIGQNTTLNLQANGGSSMLLFTASANSELRTGVKDFVINQPASMSAIGSYVWITFENPNNTQTSGTGIGLNVDLGFTSAGGNANFTSLAFTDKIIQTGGANGITRAIHINPTLTTSFDYRAIEISNTAGRGIHQTSSVPLNHFAGNAGFGVLTPVARVHIAAGTAALGSLQIAPGVALTTPLAGMIENLGNQITFTQSAGPTRRTICLIVAGSAVLDFPNTAAGTSSDLTIAVSGASDGDPVMVGVPIVSQVANGVFSAFVSAANVVTVRFSNNSLVAAIDPASGTFKVTVSKS